jgi:hypothetical protein
LKPIGNADTPENIAGAFSKALA